MPALVTPEEWGRIQPLLDRALELTPPELSAFLSESSGSDESLRAELERMLIDCRRLDPLLERPAFERFQSLMEPEAESWQAITAGSKVAERYVIAREIGQGGSATVYLAHDLKHDRAVALKVLHAELAVGQWAERFLRETLLTSRLQHPNILPLHDSGEVGATLYFVMPFVEGESLRQRLAREHQLPVVESVRLVCEVARALDYAHEVGVLHRDVKPENILLSEGRPLLADFGVASSVAGTGDSLTKTGFVVGTPAYMAPEQASAEGRVDNRSDLYALACVLYELLTGQPPYSGPTSQSVLLQHMGASIPSPAVLRPSLSPELAAVVQRALAKLPVDRYASCAAFARALEEASNPGAAPPRWSRTSVTRMTRQLLLGGICVMVGGAATYWVVDNDGMTRTDPYRPRQIDVARREAAAAPAYDAASAPGVNVAAGMPSFQSSTMDPLEPGVQTKAFLANDGDLCAFFSCGGHQHTDWETNPWWYVDLRQQTSIKAIRILNIKTVGPTGRLFPFTISVHAEGQAGFTAFGAPAVWSGRMAVQPHPDPLVYDFALPAGTEGRYVKLQLDGLNWLHVAEVEVYR